MARPRRRELLTIDRSNLANNIWFPQEYLPGVSLSQGRRAPWVYRAAIYSSGEVNREFGEFNGGVATLGVLGYDFAPKLGVQRGAADRQLRLSESGSRQHVHATARAHRLDQLPIRSSQNGARDRSLDGLRVPRPERHVGVPGDAIRQRDRQIPGRRPLHVHRQRDPTASGWQPTKAASSRAAAIEYNELYLGANYYFYGHRLKLQTGLQWADMKDRANDGGAYSGVSWTTGLRVGW